MPPYSTRPLSAIVGVDIHYTASPSSVSVESIAAYQTGPGAQEAFPAIAYSMVVDGQGVPYLCHDLTTRCWHSGAPGANTTRLSVCWIGVTTPTQAQIDGMGFCVAWLQEQLGRALDMRGHRDGYPGGQGTQCPGPWPGWRRGVTEAIERYGG